MTRKAAVIGAPVSHSRSPAIFSFLAERLGTADFDYSAREILPAGLPGFLDEVRSGSTWVGLNVTIPHKEAVIWHLDSLSEDARAVGAVNVVHADNGKLRGHNTDVFGVLRTLELHDCAIRGQDAWIWGAGGAARAVTYALGKLGARRVYLRNRGTERARELARSMSTAFPQTRFLVDEAPSDPLWLLVNTTPLGMTRAGASPPESLMKGIPADAESFIELDRLPLKSGALAFDLIYAPEETPFLSLAEKRGLRVAGGLRMLVEQALATWEIWFGGGHLSTSLLGDELVSRLRSLLSERPIILVGLMGVGKSAVGAVLARKLGWSFLDTDEAIVRRAGKPMAEIFRDSGEAEFRRLEAEAVSEATRMNGTVVALGGGALTNPALLPEKVRNAGRLVHLRASLDSLERRLGSARGRPLLAGLSSEQRRARLSEILEARRPAYESATHQLDTDGASPEELAERLRAMLFPGEKK